jgi:hypothetical protein
LHNAGWDLRDFVIDPTNTSIMSDTSSYGSAEFESLFADEMACSNNEWKLSKPGRNALIDAAPGSGGLDFDLVIPCLLLLQIRQADWRDSDQYASTQSLLDAAPVIWPAGTIPRKNPTFCL